MAVRENTLSHIMVTRLLGGAVAMVTISFQNREGYVRSAIRISVTCHARKLPLRLESIFNIPILVWSIISQTSLVIPQWVSYKLFLMVLIVNGHDPTLIGSLWLSKKGMSVEVETSLDGGHCNNMSKVLFHTCSSDKYVVATASISGWRTSGSYKLNQSRCNGRSKVSLTIDIRSKVLLTIELLLSKQR